MYLKFWLKYTIKVEIIFEDLDAMKSMLMKQVFICRAYVLVQTAIKERTL